MGQIPQECAVLVIKRFIETHLLPKFRQRLLGCPFTQDRKCRISGDEMNHEEYEQRYSKKRKEHREQTLKDVGKQGWS